MSKTKWKSFIAGQERGNFRFVSKQNPKTVFNVHYLGDRSILDRETLDRENKKWALVSGSRNFKSSVPTMNLAMEISKDSLIFTGGAIGVDSTVMLSLNDMKVPQVIMFYSGLDDPKPLTNVDNYIAVVDNGGLILTPFNKEHQYIKGDPLYRDDVMVELCNEVYIMHVNIQKNGDIYGGTAHTLRSALKKQKREKQRGNEFPVYVLNVPEHRVIIESAEFEGVTPLSVGFNILDK